MDWPSMKSTKRISSLETLEQYAYENSAETFLGIDGNKDNIIPKKVGENAAIKIMEDFDQSPWMPNHLQFKKC